MTSLDVLVRVTLAPMAFRALLRPSVSGAAELLEPPTCTPVSSMAAGWPATVTPLSVVCSSWVAIPRPSVREVEVELRASMWMAPPANEIPLIVVLALASRAPSVSNICLVWATALSMCSVLLSSARGVTAAAAAGPPRMAAA